MRSSQLKLDQYDSDKIAFGFLDRYDPMFEDWVEKEIVLLELGVRKGGSLLLWRDYFPRGRIVGIDISLPRDMPPTERVQVFEGSQADTEFLSRVAKETAPRGFDIIIDDASHIGLLTKTSFWHLFDNHLKSGGLYVIEDWGTGYWDDWPDGRSLDLDSYLRSPPDADAKAPMPCHSHGMVGLVKQLVDEQGAHDATRKHSQGHFARWSKFQSLTITPSIVFVRKSSRSV